MSIALAILAAPFAFSAIFIGVLIGSRAAVREAIARGAMVSVCRVCGARASALTVRIPLRRKPSESKAPDQKAPDHTMA